jgi:hypothetical protein
VPNRHNGEEYRDDDDGVSVEIPSELEEYASPYDNNGRGELQVTEYFVYMSLTETKLSTYRYICSFI